MKMIRISYADLSTILVLRVLWAKP